MPNFDWQVDHMLKSTTEQEHKPLEAAWSLQSFNIPSYESQLDLMMKIQQEQRV